MRHLSLASISTLVALAACAEPTAPPPPEPASQATSRCTGTDTAPSPLSRLNTREYRNTVRDLFGLTELGALPDDNVPVDFGYDNSVHNTSVSQLRANALFENAERIAELVSSQLDSALDCQVDDADAACIDRFIHSLGRRVYRRPLDAAEHATLRTLDEQAIARGDTLRVRIRLLVQSMSLAPQFIYKPESGEPGVQTGNPTLVALSDHEVATRLSYLLWASSPDEALLDRADAGALSTREQVAEEAERMLGDPRARRGVVHFMMQWLDVRQLELATRDASTYPSFDTALASSMSQELRQFFERVVFEEEGSLSDLLRAKQTMVDQALAELYGVEHPGGDTWQLVSLPENERQGVLSLAGFLTAKAHPIQPAPVQRGKFVRTRLLCQPVPDPPDDIDTSVDPTGIATTNRQLLAQHSADPSCAGCHQYMDPIGFGMENFDSIGQYRTTDNGLPVDASGELIEAGDVSGPFSGPIELSERLADSTQARACMTRQVFRYAMGRVEENQDACSLEQLEQSDIDDDGSIRQLLITIASSDGFRFRKEVK